VKYHTTQIQRLSFRHRGLPCRQITLLVARRRLGPPHVPAQTNYTYNYWLSISISPFSGGDRLTGVILVFAGCDSCRRKQTTKELHHIVRRRISAIQPAFLLPRKQHQSGR